MVQEDMKIGWRYRPFRPYLSSHEKQELIPGHLMTSNPYQCMTVFFSRECGDHSSKQAPIFRMDHLAWTALFGATRSSALKGPTKI
ncbi:hypothetical protein CCR75_004224 [Bremia lactucae]|uniref:Uncharacterized protein n=1 Tax=Bremia lactucae TaxID=4779 RepID=A0A976FQJ6_BRELC|nr:hypothetical protein CCR75_004224 [Bremia lactucae]